MSQKYAKRRRPVTLERILEINTLAEAGHYGWVNWTSAV